MEIKELIAEKIRKNGQVTSAELTEATGFSRTYVNRFLKQLVNEKRIALVGKANQAKYLPAGKETKPKIVSKILRNKNLQEDLILGEIKNSSSIFSGLPKNIDSILAYAFTEMLNNAIEHSGSKTLAVKINKNAKSVNFTVRDIGVGVFRNVKKKFHLENEVEGINHLLKGRQTTLPKVHSGEGIFFTSKAADIFILESFGKRLVVDNLADNIFIKDIKSLKGTRVTFEKKFSSRGSLAGIFNTYAGENFQFSKTKILVNLGQVDKIFISRSQARRIIFGLDKFKEITLDFKGVISIGQAFADEIFGVWQKDHPKISIKTQSANSNSMLMINRARLN